MKTKKNIKEYVTDILGFKIKLINVPVIEIDNEEIVNIDFTFLSEQVFFDLLRAPIRLTGNQVKFMRKHLGLKQEDMKRVLGVEQSNFSRLEAKRDSIAFENDIDLIALKAEFAKIKIQQQQKSKFKLQDFIHQAGEFRDPEKTFVRKMA